MKEQLIKAANIKKAKQEYDEEMERTAKENYNKLQEDAENQYQTILENLNPTTNIQYKL